MDTEHEQLAAEGEREADDLQRAGERLQERVDEARKAAETAAADPFIPTPAGDEPDEGGEETDYPAKR
jgi:hypothetical protein